MRVPGALVPLILALVASPACSENPKPEGAPAGTAASATEVSFVKDIKPLLSKRCTICHNTEVLPKRPNFETGKAARKSGVIVPGEPAKSRFLGVMEEDPQADKAMPPVSHRLTKKEIALVRQWIAEGAKWPEGKAGRVKPAFIPKE